MAGDFYCHGYFYQLVTFIAGDFYCFGARWLGKGHFISGSSQAPNHQAPGQPPAGPAPTPRPPRTRRDPATWRLRGSRFGHNALSMVSGLPGYPPTPNARRQFMVGLVGKARLSTVNMSLFLSGVNIVPRKKSVFGAGDRCVFTFVCGFKRKPAGPGPLPIVGVLSHVLPQTIAPRGTHLGRLGHGLSDLESPWLCWCVIMWESF